MITTLLRWVVLTLTLRSTTVSGSQDLPIDLDDTEATAFLQKVWAPPPKTMTSSEGECDKSTFLLRATIPVKDKYVIGKLLGGGQQGHVSECTSKEDDQVYALKQIKIPDFSSAETDDTLMEPVEDTLKEVLAMKSFNHDNIIKVVEVFETWLDDSNETLVSMVMPFYDYDLEKLIKEKKMFPEHEAVEITKSIVSGVAAMHSVRVIHRDLKPCNIFINTNKDFEVEDCVVGDLGRCVRFDAPYPVHNEDGFVAPELQGFVTAEKLKGSPERADNYAIGALVYYMLTGTKPKGNNIDALKPTFKALGLREAAQDFISKCMETEPADRLSCEEILKHPFLSSKLRRLLC